MTAGLLLCCKAQDKTPTSVGSVDLERYAGKWYDVASFPVRFQKGCHCTTAEYTLMPEGYIKVDNRCRKGGFNEKISGITGKAFSVKESNNTKLKVQFFWPFRSDYWIVRLDKDYSWAVVSNSSMKYLWILSRTPEMDEEIFQNIIEDLKNDGYDTDKLVKVPQSCG
ncbi:MAG: lipocalin family protein [Lentimicrobium sp.]|nr:lipocalin family protein [Lentimicrobium sp.]